MKGLKRCLAIVVIGVLGFNLSVEKASSAPGDLYVSEPAAGAVSRFAPDGTKTTFVSGLDNPAGLAFDQSGNLFVTVGVQPGSIIKLAPNGEMTVFATDLNWPGALAFDGAGNLFLTENTGDVGSVSKFTPDGTKTIVNGGGVDTEGGNPGGLAFSSASNLFVALLAGPFNFNGGIVWFAPDGTGHIFSYDGGPGMAFDKAGNLYIGRGSEIVKFTPLPERAESVFASGFNGPGNLAFDAAGNLFVAEFAPPASFSISKVTPDGNRTIFTTDLQTPAFLAFEPVIEKLRNLSARGLVGPGDDVLIGGFIVGGNALSTNAVVVRALGPSLSHAGVSNPLGNPVLELHNSTGTLIASNEDWQDSQAEQITASGLAPTDPKESAIYAMLPAGNYTAIVRGTGAATGTALVEVFSVSK